MTLQNGMIHGGKVYLWTDTMVLNGDTCEVVGVMPKAFYGLRHPFAGTVSNIGAPPQSLMEAIGHGKTTTEDELLQTAQVAMMDYCADGSIARLLLACCYTDPRLYYIASDDALGVPFAAYSTTHYLCPQHEINSDPVTFAQMPSKIADQVTGKFMPFGPLGASGKRQAVGGTIVQIEVSPDGVTEQELVLRGKAGRALKRVMAGVEARAA